MDFPSNSHNPPPKDGEDEKADKVILKVVTGEVVRRRKPLGNRFLETFFGGDVKGVTDYVIKDVLLPAAKDMIADAVNEGIQRMIFGSDKGPTNRRGSNRSTNGPVNYSRYSPTSKTQRDEPRNISRRARASHDFDEIILATRTEATDVIHSLDDLIGRYGIASVAELYELVGISSSHTDEKWGWTSMDRADITRTRSGYLLNLPATEPID
jgi:hypothetical protein